MTVDDETYVVLGLLLYNIAVIGAIAFMTMVMGPLALFGLLALATTDFDEKVEVTQGATTVTVRAEEMTTEHIEKAVEEAIKA